MSKVSELYGVETLKTALTEVAEFGEKLFEAAEDKKFKAVEIVQLGFSIPGLVKVFKQTEELRNEVLDLSEEEMQEIIQHFESEFEIDNAEAEIKVERAISALGAIYDLILTFTKSAA